MRERLIPLLLVLLLALAYGLTLAPGVTWANQGADSGGLASAAYTRGAAHPPGYPFYLGLAWLAQQLFPGGVALRTNLLSALCAVLACLVLYAALRGQGVSGLAAALGALALGLSPAVWGQAVLTEVYTLQLLLSALVLWGALAAWRSTRHDLGRGLAWGLALSNHATGLFLFPLLLLDRSPAPRPARRALLRFAVAGLTALALYASLFLRGLAPAAVNWGKVTSLPRLWWLVSGEAYRGYLSLAPDLWGKLPLLWQDLAGFGLPLLALALLALALLPRLGLQKRLTLSVALVQAAFALSYNTRDWQVNLIPLCLLAAFWLGLGLARLPGLLPPRLGTVARAGLPALAALALAWNAWTAWPLVDASRDTRADDFAAEILGAVPPNALVFTKEDRDTFALWYYHYVLGWRPDVAILPSGLLIYDWERENLRLAYPGLHIPEEAGASVRRAIIAANPERPVCSVFVEPETAFDCR